jgi:hypothetical protein
MGKRAAGRHFAWERKVGTVETTMIMGVALLVFPDNSRVPPK